MNASENHSPGASRRPGAGFVLFSFGFRPFFLGAAVWAAVAVPAWLLMYRGAIDIPSRLVFSTWHSHEMVFGFAGAAMAGFLLTAVPNWTGRLPVRGGPLIALFFLWLTARVANLVSDVWGAGLAGVLDVSLFAALFIYVLREVRAGKNYRNLPVAVAVAVFAIANGMAHLEASDVIPGTGAGLRLGISVVLMMIGLIGGRIVPSFTLNWMMRHGKDARPTPFSRYDAVTLTVTLMALLTWTVASGSPVAGGLFALAAVLHLVRLVRWAGHRTGAEPLLLILHVGYAWLPVGYGLLAVSMLANLLPETVALHALTAGAIGTMIAAVSSRAILGHTGRPLHAGPGTVALYALIVIGATLRILASFFPDQYGAWVLVAGILWASGYALFALIYGPMLLRPAVSASPPA